MEEYFERMIIINKRAISANEELIKINKDSVDQIKQLIKLVDFLIKKVYNE